MGRDLKQERAIRQQDLAGEVGLGKGHLRLEDHLGVACRNAPLDLKVMTQLENNLVLFNAATQEPIEQIYANPDIGNKEATSELMRSQRDKLIARQQMIAPFAEATLQTQVGEALADLGLTSGGQTLPPILYHTSPTPLALIVAPRDSFLGQGRFAFQDSLAQNDAERTARRFEHDVGIAVDVDEPRIRPQCADGADLRRVAGLLRSSGWPSPSADILPT